MSNLLNQNSLARALELNFQKLDNLYLIIGSSNDNRFDEFQGFRFNLVLIQYNLELLIITMKQVYVSLV